MKNKIPALYKFIIALLMLGLLITGIIIHRNKEKALINRLTEQLLSVSNAKISQLQYWVREIFFEGNFISRNKLVEDEFRAFIRNKIKYKDEIKDWCNPLIENKNISNIYITDKEGQKIFSYPDTSKFLKSESYRKIRQKPAIGKTILTNFHKSDSSDVHFHLDMVIPMFGKNEELYGFIILKLDPELILKKVLSTNEISKPDTEFLIAITDSVQTLLLGLDSAGALSDKTIYDKSGIIGNPDNKTVIKIINDEKYIESVKQIPEPEWYLISRINISKPLFEQNVGFLLSFSAICFFVLLISGVVFYFWYKQHTSTLEELVKTENEKAALNYRLGLFMKYANDIIIMMEENGKIVEVNKKALEFYGYSEEEIYNLNIRDLRPPETRADVEAKMKQVIDEDGLVFETLHQTKSGEKKPVEVSSRKIQIKGKYYFQSIVRDITERKKAEESLIEGKRKAEESEKVKSNFLANMSHELRTPLNGILGFSEILKEEATDDNSKEMAEIIHNSGIRLLNTLNQILDLSALESSKVNIQILPVNVCKILEESVRLYRGIAEKKGLILNYKCNCKTPTIIYSDENLLNKILNNLLNNAIKFTKKGEVSVKFKKLIYNGSDAVEIKVVDTGIGIPKEYHNIIFEDFKQVSEGLGRSFEGTGLGLTIVRDYVKLLEGKIEVESEPGIGSTFTVTIPSLQSEVNKVTHINMEVNTIKQVSVEKIDILYVEDDSDSRLIFKAILKDLCNIDFAESGDDAIEMAKNKEYSIIFMDINLGKGIDGIQTTKRLREIPDYKETPIFALTAFAMKGDREEFLEGGCTHYLSKPFKKDDLKNLVLKIKETL